MPGGLNIYDFLIKPLREIDVKEGNRFVERYLKGPQDAWDRTSTRIDQIPTLWSVLECEDEYLQYLKRIVGWTPDLDGITNRITPDLLRRLIAASYKIWRDRGPEDTTIDVLRVLTGMRSRIWSWFDLRYVLGETEIGEDAEGHDPYIIGGPGDPGSDEYRQYLRIVDNGTLDRQLVRDVVGLMRAAGERITITYLAFLDLFDVEGDWFQWRQEFGTTMLVTGGCIHLSDTGSDELALVDTIGAASWGEIMVTGRMRSSAIGVLGLFFHYTSMLDLRFFVIDIELNQAYLLSITGGTITIYSTVDLAPLGIVLRENTFYMLRVDAARGISGDHLQAYIDGVEVFNLDDTVARSGTAGLWHAPVADLEASEFEVCRLPLDSEEIGLGA
jgi:hypothetical protein